MRRPGEGRSVTGSPEPGVSPRAYLGLDLLEEDLVLPRHVRLRDLCRQRERAADQHVPKYTVGYHVHTYILSTLLHHYNELCTAKMSKLLYLYLLTE